jgi:Cyclin, C-terminal domain
MHLRSLWFRAVSQNNLINPQEMHIYALASFLLQLSLLDLPCCACAPSQLAAAALSLAMLAFNKPAWPRALETYGSYTLEDLEPHRQKLAAVQADLTASQLRRCWNMTYVAQDVEHTDAWKQAMAVFDCPSSTLVAVLGGNRINSNTAMARDDDRPQAVFMPAPAPGIHRFESDDGEDIIEIDDDTSSVSTDSAINGDILLLSSAPMSPTAIGEIGSACLDIGNEVTASLDERESDDEGYEMAVPMSVVKGAVSAPPRGVFAAP